MFDSVFQPVFKPVFAPVFGKAPLAQLLLLDAYPDAACAYSTRLLRAAYTGPCLRLRREYPSITGNTSGALGSTISAVSNLTHARIGLPISGAGIQADTVITSIDAGAQTLTVSRVLMLGGSSSAGLTLGNDELDIGFAADQLDTAAAQTFVAQGTGRVSVWYGQHPGAQNAVQTTAARQPFLITSGLLERQNGKPALRVAGAETLAVTSLTLPTFSEVLALWKWAGSGGNFFLEHGPDANNFAGFYFYGTNHAYWRAFRNALTQHESGTQPQWAPAILSALQHRYGGTAPEVRANGVVPSRSAFAGAAPPDTIHTDQLNILSRNQASLLGSGHLTELLIWPGNNAARYEAVLADARRFWGTP